MKFALIKNGVVENVFEADNYRDSELVAIAHEGQAVNIDQYNTGIGHSYTGGKFYAPDGVFIPRMLTMEEKIEVIQSAMDELIMGGM